MDYQLRTDTKEETDAALVAAGILAEQVHEGVTTLVPTGLVAIDYIGSISKPPITDEEGVVITPGTTDSRFHTNIRVCFEMTEEQIELLPIVDPAPAIPYRVFA
jgi:hypothetical protein